MFFEHGFGSTGVDTLTSGCGFAKMSLYRYFPSKDELIAQILLGVRSALEKRLNLIVENPHLSACQKLELVFIELCQAMADPELMAGLLSRALVEFPDREHPAHKAALACKQCLFRLSIM